MIFNSLQYALFLPIVVILYFTLPQKYRWFFLLVVSYYFYMCWNAKYALLMMLSTVITFYSSVLLHKAADRKLKIFYLVSSLVVNLSILFLFKYFNFFNQTIADVVHIMGIQYQPSKLSLLLPVGISFYTFQALGYTIDVFKGKTEPIKHFGKYALFVSFFPQLVAGPIERIENLAPQFNIKHKFDYDSARSGLLIIGQGLIKKVVIADRLAILVNTVYNTPAEHSGGQFVLATIFFAFQIYCDFSGYSDIAVGSARILGYNLMVNFKRPYLATSIADFWKRWHISLTSWFKDNVYIPLGGNRKRHLQNILVVFLISGLWHGASLTFLIWGLLNGLYQVVGIITKRYTNKLKAVLKLTESSLLSGFLRRFLNFALVCFAWVFFRANNVNDLKLILTKLFTWNQSFFTNLNVASFGMDKPDILISLTLIVLLMIYEWLQEKVGLGSILMKKPLVLRWTVYLTVLIIIILFGVYGDANNTQFIYFQF